jgi:hypothetical protein
MQNLITLFTKAHHWTLFWSSPHPTFYFFKQVLNIMSFSHYLHCAKYYIKVWSPVWYSVTYQYQFCTARSCYPSQISTWTNVPCQPYTTAYSIHSQLPSIQTISSISNQRTHHSTIKKKKKEVIPEIGCEDPQGYEMSRIPHFRLTISSQRAVRVSALHAGHP